jgi:hypothetical protein
MKQFMHAIGFGFVLLTVATALGLSQEPVAPGGSQGLTTAEMRAINSEGNPKKRAEKAIKLANEKAEQARKNALEGNSAEAENAAKGLETALNHAWSNIQQAEVQGADMTDTIAKVSEATAKHSNKLSEVLDRVPDQAKPHIEHAMEVSQRGHDHALDALEKAATQQSDPQRRASRLLDVADGRARQVREATTRGNSEDARRAAQGYERSLTGALNAVDVGQQQGQDMETIMNRIAQATARQQETLQEVRDRVPEEAHAAIDQAMEVSQNGHEIALAKLEQARTQRSDAAGGGYGSSTGRAPMDAGANSPMGPPAGIGGSGRGGGPPAGAGGGRR